MELRKPILSVVTALGALLLALKATGVSSGLAWAGFGLVIVVTVSSVLIGEPVNGSVTVYRAMDSDFTTSGLVIPSPMSAVTSRSRDVSPYALASRGKMSVELPG
ncbi:hypothetical protein [Streptomyces sp. NBC_01429]|uniref:hypothetical protein n=1 Tax=Streptomyces sp. NBC_01429 TaxID=2903862 RepID=UPI002E2A25CB|nr:hypothetical protein [Streptomyces sp. NBC_01429]